jgi:hypothetical protein
MHRLKHNQIFSLVCLFSIVLIAFLLRSRDYLNGDFFYFLDQARDLSLVKDIVYNNHIVLIGGRAGLGGIFHGPLWLYMIVPFFLLAKGNPFYTLIPLFSIVSLLPIIIAYIGGKKLYGMFFAVTLALLLAISQTLINASYSTSNAHMMPVLFLGYIFLAVCYLRGTERVLPFIGLIIGISFQFQSAFAIFLIPLTVILLILSKKMPTLKTIALSSLAMLVGVSTFLVFELKNQFLMTKTALNLAGGGLKPMRDYEQFANVGYRVMDRFQHLLNFFTFPTFERSSLYFLLIGITLLCGFYLLFSRRGKNKKGFKKEILFVLIVPFLYLAIYTSYPFPLWEHYMYALPVASCFLLSHAITAIYRKIPHIGYILLLILCIPSFVWLFRYYVGSQSTVTVRGNYKVQQEVVNYIYDDANGKPLSYMVYDSGGLTYNMDYLMWYTGNRVYNNNPINGKTDNFYVIMTPSPKWDAGASGVWKETVVNTKGKVLSRKEFPEAQLTVEHIRPDSNEPKPDEIYFQNLIFR